jgi:polyhydroxyalkanoate synthesis regulator phasin
LSLATLKEKKINPMKSFSWLRRPIAKFGLVLLVTLVLAIAMQMGGTHAVFAQSDTALRSEVQSLRSRVSRLESALSSVRSGSRQTTPSTPRQSSPAQEVNGELVGRTDPLFQRLANLTIELRERVATLEKRVAQLERR